MSQLRFEILVSTDEHVTRAQLTEVTKVRDGIDQALVINGVLQQAAIRAMLKQPIFTSLSAHVYSTAPGLMTVDVTITLHAQVNVAALTDAMNAGMEQCAMLFGVQLDDGVEETAGAGPKETLQ